MKGLLCLKWNNHSAAFDKLLNNLHLKDAYSDGTLMCHGKFYPIHRFVLSTCSEYFEEIFSQCKQMECKHPFIIVKDIQPSQIEALLNYMYMGEVNVPQEMLPELIKAAEAFRIKGLAVPDDEPPPSKSSIKDRKRSSVSPSSHIKKSQRLEEKISRNQETTNNSSVIESDLSISSNLITTNSEIFLKRHLEEEQSHLSKRSKTEDSFKLEKKASDDIVKKEPVEPADYHEQVYADTLEDPPIKEEQPFSLTEDENPDNSDLFDIAQSSSWDDGQCYEGEELDDSSQMIDETTNFVHVPRCDTYLMSGSDTYSTATPELSKEKPYSCTLCSFRTVSRTNLENHVRIHTGEKPYHCPRCPYRATQRANLHTHMKTHTGIKPFCCNLCDYRTAYKHRLASHLMSHERKCV